MVKDLIKLLDDDKDGKLSEEEFMGYYLHRQMEFDMVRTYSENLNCYICTYV